jgi:hypothetical protein
MMNHNALISLIILWAITIALCASAVMILMTNR